MTSTSPENTLSPELAVLAAEGAALDREAAPADPKALEQVEAEPVDYLGDSNGLVDIVAESMGAFWPSTLAVLVPEKRQRIAAALAPVLQKYGVSMASIFGRFGEEIALGFALAQLVIPLSTAIRQDRLAAAVADGTVKAVQAAPQGQAPVIDRTDPASLHLKA